MKIELCLSAVWTILFGASLSISQDVTPVNNNSVIRPLPSLDLESLGAAEDFLPNDYPSLHEGGPDDFLSPHGGGPDDYLSSHGGGLDDYLNADNNYDYSNYDYGDYGSLPPLDINATVKSSFLHKCRCKAHQVLLANDTCVDYTTSVQVIHPQTEEPQIFNTTDFKFLVPHELECKDDFFVDHPEHFIIQPTGDLLDYGQNVDLPYDYYCIEHTLDEAENFNWKASVCLPKPMLATCCGEGEVLGPGSNICIPYKGNMVFTPPINNDQVLLDKHQLGNSTVHDIGCTGAAVKEVELNGETAALHYHIDRPPQLLFHNKYMISELSPEYCLAARETEDGSLKYYARFCHEDVCENSTCVRKCCGPEKIIENGTCTYADRYVTLNYTFHQKENISIVDETPEIHQYYGMLVHCTADKGYDGVIELKPKTNPVYAYYLLNDGSLYLPLYREGGVCGTDSYYSIDSFCMDSYMDEDGEYSQLVLLCHKDLGIKGCEAGTVLYPILMAISCVFLVFTLIVYLGVPNLRQRTYGRCLISLVVSILVVYITFICNYAGILESNASCYAAAFIGHLSSLSMFFWLSVMGFDMWSTLRSSKPQSQSKKLFVRYSFYGWGFPLFFALIALAIRLLPETEDYCHIVRPDYVNHGRGCSFNSLTTRWVYQYWVILLLTFVNIFFFIHVTITLVRNHRQTKKILQSPNSSQSNSEKKQSKMWLYIKLFLVMGITWIIEVISSKDCGWIVGDIFNLLQGVLIFVITVCKKDVFNKIYDAWGLQNLGNGITTLRDRMSRVDGSTTSPDGRDGGIFGCCGQKWSMVDTVDSNDQHWTPLESIKQNQTQTQQ